MLEIMINSFTMCRFTNMANCCIKHQSSYLPETVHGDSLWGCPTSMTVNHTLIYQWKRNMAITYIGRCRDNWVTKDTEIKICNCTRFVSSCILDRRNEASSENHVRSVLQRTQYYQILFSLVNYCTIYNYYSRPPGWIILYIAMLQ
jgi:hypothetical protein